MTEKLLDILFSLKTLVVLKLKGYEKAYQ